MEILKFSLLVLTVVLIRKTHCRYRLARNQRLRAEQRNSTERKIAIHGRIAC